MELYKLPPVIMVHLKRFSFDAKVGEVRKVFNEVQEYMALGGEKYICREPNPSVEAPVRT